MGLDDADLVDDGEGGKAAVSVSCSICLEVVADDGDRSWAKLQCGHQFHLDCIGSAFNVKGVMQCPNCRKIEKGQWLYANGCRLYPEFSMDDWAHDEDLYSLSYTETTSMWCPFGGFTRLAASFDEGEFPTAAYHDLLGQYAIFSEHAATVSSTAHLCPYFAYVQPVHPSSSSSTSGASVADGSTPTTYNNNDHNSNNSQWNSSQSASSEMPNSYALPNMDVRYHSTLFSPSNNRLGVGGADQPVMPSVMPRRPVRNNTDMPRSASYVHPFLVGQSAATAARTPSSVGSSMIHPHPGSAARARERAQALQTYFQQPSSLPGLHTHLVSGSRRSNSQAQMGQMGSSSDQIHGSGIYYLATSGSSTTRSGFQEVESSIPNPFHHTWERNQHLGPGWGFYQGGGGGGSAAVFRVRHGSERTPSQGHYRS